MNKICIFIISALILFTPMSIAEAEDAGGYGGAFLQTGVSARVLGMGGAFVGLADDTSSIFWNVGGMSQLKGTYAEFMRAQMSLDRSYNFLAFCQGLEKYGAGGLGWINYSVSDIPAYDEEGNYLGNFSDSENAFLIGYSYGIKETLLLGSTLKLYRTKLAGYKSSGSGFDFGTLLKIDEKYLCIGFSAQNLNASAKWDTPSERVDPYSTVYRVGVKTETPFKPISILFDLEKHQKMDVKYHFGAEYWYYNGDRQFLGLRGGLNNGDYSFGGSVNFSFGSSIVGFDYSYSKDPIGAGNTHRFSLGVEFPAIEREELRDAILIEPSKKYTDQYGKEKPEEPSERDFDQIGKEKIQVKSHTVESGDCLFNIAGQIYHDPFKWPLIYEENRDKISDPHWIYPDMELIIPIIE